MNNLNCHIYDKRLTRNLDEFIVGLYIAEILVLQNFAGKKTLVDSAVEDQYQKFYLLLKFFITKIFTIR